MTPPSPRLSRFPFVLLGLMTVSTIGGPLAIGWVLRDGASPVWPPDRPVEWAVVILVCALVLGLMMSCVSLAWVNRRAMTQTSKISESGRTRVEP